MKKSKKKENEKDGEKEKKDIIQMKKQSLIKYYDNYMEEEESENQDTFEEETNRTVIGVNVEDGCQSGFVQSNLPQRHTSACGKLLHHKEEVKEVKEDDELNGFVVVVVAFL